VELTPSLYEFVDHPQGSHSGSRIFFFVGRLKENTVCHCGWSALCLHTAPTESSTHKGVNFGIHHGLRVPQLFVNPSSFTYALYIMIVFVFNVL
jgi:hypothetical protein